MDTDHKGVGAVIEFSSLDAATQDLIRRGNEVRARAYCPYSKFRVGAALMAADGQIYSGCNVETAAHGTICAERSAVVKAVSEGRQTFQKVAVVAYLPEDFVSPCGPCRQFIAEFGSETAVYLSKPDMDKVLVTSIQELLPLSFRLKGKVEGLAM